MPHQSGQGRSRPDRIFLYYAAVTSRKKAPRDPSFVEGSQGSLLDGGQKSLKGLPGPGYAPLLLMDIQVASLNCIGSQSLTWTRALKYWVLGPPGSDGVSYSDRPKLRIGVGH